MQNNPPSERPRVLFVDYCIGFGGATKSLALIYEELTTVDRILLSSQAREVLDVWFPLQPVHRFRTVVNYRNRARAREWIARAPVRRALGGLLLRGFALMDAFTEIVNLARIAWIVWRRRIDVLHLNNGFIPPEALLAARVLRLPWVVHMRGMPESMVRAGKRLPRQVHRVIAVSHAVAKAAMDRGIPADRITVVHDPVDVKRFDAAVGERPFVREMWGLEEDDVAVAILGRVVKWKGQLEFTRAVLQALESNPRIKGVIIGDESDGAADYFNAIKRLIHESRWGHRFLLTGYQEDVEPSYTALDIVVHASVEPEPFGMVVTEAMAARRAVIATAAGGPLEVITPDVDGVLVPPGDVDALARAMLRLASDPAGRESLGAKGYENVQRRFTIERAAAAVRAVHAEVASLSGRTQ